MIPFHIKNYLSTEVLARIVPMVVTLVTVKFMTPSEFGEVALVLTYSMLLTGLVSYGFGSMVAREASVLNKKQFGNLVAAGGAVMLLNCVAIVLILLMLNYFSLIESSFGQSLIVLIVILGFVSGFADIYTKILVAFNKSREFSISQTTKVTLIALFTLVPIVFYSSISSYERLLAITFGAVLGLIVTYRFIASLLVIKGASRSNILSIYSYGSKVLPQVISNWAKMGADKVFVAAAIGVSELGAYALAVTLCSLIMVVGNALNNSYIARSMSYYQSKKIMDLKALRHSYTKILVFSSLTITVGIFIFRFSLWPAEYHVDILVIFFLVSSYFLQAVYLLYVKIFMFQLKMGVLGAMNLLFVAIYILCLLVVDLNTQLVAFIFLIYNFGLTFYVVWTARSEEREMVLVCFVK